MAADLNGLARATDLVAREYRGPNCVEASALLVEVGARLGWSLVAQPVSMFAINNRSGATTVTGELGRVWGTGFLSRLGKTVEEVGRFEGGSPFERVAGHMVVTSVEHGLLMDPTFAQFAPLGEAAVPLFVSETAPHKSGRFWEVGDDDFYVRYFVADGFGELEIDALRASMSGRADSIAAQVRSIV